MGEYRLRGWKSRVLRNVFGRNKTLKKVHSEEICDFSSYIMKIKWKDDYLVRPCYEGEEKSIHFLAEEAEGNRPLGSQRSRWENVIIDLKATGWERSEWIYLAYDTEEWWAVMNAVMKFRVSKDWEWGNFLSS
jgi:hypothetical protein